MSLAFSFVILLALGAFLRPGKVRAGVYKERDLLCLDKECVGGGTGTLAGRYSFTRDMPLGEHAVREIAWLRLAPGDSIGLHTHTSNEDVYVIVSGQGLFTDADGSEHSVSSGDITIARKGESHALANTGKETLVFVSLIAE